MNAIAFAPHGQSLAIGSDTGHVRVFDWRTGRLLREDAGNQGISALAYDRQGKYRADGDEAGTITISDAKSGKIIRSIETPSKSVRALAFGPGGGWIAGAGWSGGGDDADPRDGVMVWDTRTGKRVKTLAVPGIVNDLALSPDGGFLASGSGRFMAGGHLFVWDVKSWKQRFHAEGDLVTSLAFAPNTAMMVTGGSPRVGGTGGIMSLLSATTGAPAATFPHDATVVAVRYARDGKTIAAADSNGNVTMRAATGGKVIRRMAGAGRIIEFSPDGSTLACGGDAPVVKLYSVSTGKLLRAIPVP